MPRWMIPGQGKSELRSGLSAIEDQMKKAADELYEDYLSDKELTAFTNLDFEDFYETR